ncbi:GGDEF domain-containing protein [Tahibacter amnicola]|uniref:diguanylate cyclase n=1 Tax=Tahibacter amnicola TaxID=2976241 RepID=A0ABY6BFQ9_9GAMM|nr:GGDEF domain-containing protein [Tahibacter amnicola]UXI66702.1 GGDEF domain-containing protein [Tahibacter amnicola]
MRLTVHPPSVHRRPARVGKALLSAFFALAAHIAVADISPIERLRRLSLDAPSHALTEGERLLALPEVRAAPPDQREILMLMGRASMMLASLKQTEAIAARLDALAESRNLPTAHAEASLLRASSLLDQGKYEEGLRLGTAAAAQLRVDGDAPLQRRAIVDMCEFLILSENATQARSYCERGRDEAVTAGDDFNLARALHYLAGLERDAEHNEQALALTSQTRALFEKLGMPSMAASLDDEIASLHLAEGNAAEALRLAQNALAFERAAGRQAHAALSMITTAQAQSQLGRHDEARRTIADALRRIRSAHAAALLPSALLTQMDIADAAGDRDTAFAAAKEALLRLEEQTSRESRRSMVELEAKYANLEKQRLIDTLEHENHVKELALSRAEADAERKAAALERERLTLWLMAAVAVGLFASVLLLFTLLRTQREQSRRLRHLSETDPLTGAANRREFLRELGEVYERALKNGRDASLLLIDADHFKAINDRHGHQVGDQALLAIATAIRGTIRDGDMLGRLGGEEFGVVLADADHRRARNLAEAMILAVCTATFTAPAGPVPLGISVGVASIRPHAPGSPEAWFSAADRALYAAKHSGRGRAVCEGDLPEVVSA